MKPSRSIRDLATVSVVAEVVGAAKRAARAFSPEIALSTTERLTLAYITLRLGSAPVVGGPGDACWPRVAEVASAIGRSLRTVRYACRALEEKGLLASEVVLRGASLPDGTFASRETLVVRSVGSLKGAKVEGLRGAVAKAFHDGLRGLDGGGLTASRRAALAVLLIHAGEGGWCWPSYATVAAMTGLTERTVGSAIRELVAAGHVVRELVAPTWESPKWATRYRPSPTLVSRRSVDETRSAASQPCNGFLATRQPLPTKETTEGETNPAVSPEEQLYLFRLGPRAVEVDAVMQAAAAMPGADLTTEGRFAVQARLSEGLVASDIVGALRSAQSRPGDIVSIVRRVTRSKAVVLAYLGHTDAQRAAAAAVNDHGAVDVKADRELRACNAEMVREGTRRVLEAMGAPPPFARRSG